MANPPESSTIRLRATITVRGRCVLAVCLWLARLGLPMPIERIAAYVGKQVRVAVDNGHLPEPMPSAPPSKA